MSKPQIESVAELACRSALAYGGVAHHTSNAYAHAAGLPEDSGVQAAAVLLNAGERVARLVGQGALGAGVEVEQVAEVLAAPVVKALLGTRPSQEAIDACDTLLIVGSSFAYIECYPKQGQSRAAAAASESRPGFPERS